MRLPSGFHIASSGAQTPELVAWLNFRVRRVTGEGVWVPGTRGRTARGVALRRSTIGPGSPRGLGNGLRVFGKRSGLMPFESRGVRVGVFGSWLDRLGFSGWGKANSCCSEGSGLEGVCGLRIVHPRRSGSRSSAAGLEARTASRGSRARRLFGVVGSVGLRDVGWVEGQGSRP
jgi:hypothetical protein